MSITITAPSSSAEYTGNLSSPVLPASALHLQGALSPELDTPEIHSKFESALQKIDPTLEIRRLNSVIIELKTLFRKLFLDFGKHDREAKRLGVRSDGLDGVQPLAPQWDVLRKRFHTLIDESQTNAMDASAVLKQYVNIFTEETLQSRDCSIIKAEIDNLVLMIDDRANRARTIEGSFSDLSEDVRTFDDNTQDTLAAIHANAKVVYQELEGTRHDIRALHERLTQVTKEMTEMGIACIACLSTGALSAGAFTICCAPEVLRTVKMP
ncbi:hypothetical protein ONZ51_g11934 [Trametes cubensis]|uniref:Uncharacterized protein n=1 Tax=Trametes cubensis TaxID=1111947 RepID=A0AAD7TH71_9APHY|nr:hypothetical protein ONZ51_g11934 [Trametes cubensis]